jgi:autotransporter-associated beta strand protein
VISGTGFGIVKTGAGTLTLSGVNTYTGSTDIGTAGGTDAGTLSLGVNSALVSTGAVNIYGGTFDFNSRTQTIGALMLGGGASGSTASITGTTGILTLGGDVTYNATNNPNGAAISGGTITLGANRTINVGNSSGSAGTDLRISSAMNLNSHGLIVTGAGGTTISGVIGGSGASSTLTKNGTGRLTLTAANTYGSSSTTVNGGMLLVNNTTGSGTGGGPVTVNSGGTIGGTGTISGRLTVNAGGTLAPGNGDHKTAIFTVGLLTLEPNSTFSIDINGTAPGTGYDQLQVTGAGGAGGAVITNSNLQVHVGTTVTVGDQFTIAHHAGGYMGQFLQGSFVTANNGDVFSINYAGGPQGYDMVLKDVSSLPVVPEPSTWIGGALAAAALAYTQRRRLKKLFLLRRDYGGQVVSS